ncbi:MAG TPA: GNAT family N-acetyltransferase, partial [Cellulomonas sp.]|nr:GNAT family N-acetyltransferase [Cellulomonas sp.]
YVVVRPDERGAGIGAALLARGEQIAAEAGRATIVVRSAEAPEPPAGPGTLTAPTGAGRVRADAPAGRFALRHGFTLEQVERYSVLDLASDETRGASADAHGEAAARVAGDDYRVHTWHDVVPEAWRAQLAVLMARMSTDAPSGAVDIDEEPWDAERVRAFCEQAAYASQHLTITAAEHVPSRTLAAYTVLDCPMGQVPFAFQEDTLVHADHRGRRLGMLVKAANLRALRERHPWVARVHTTNAQENEFMLAINVALGFRPAGVHAVWQKQL